MSKPFAIVAADFIPWGGMDRPNYELAWHLAERLGVEVHLVGHRVASPLAEHTKVVWHQVPKPLGRDVLGSPYLDRRGRAVAADVARAGGTVVVNGGNCLWNDVNWVHYVHNVPDAVGARPPFLHRHRMRLTRRRDRLRERKAVGEARVVIADSELTKDRLVAGISLDPRRVRTIYYGIDPDVFRPATPAERGDARRSLGLPSDRPVVAFIGGLGYDRRKGFDVLFDAWCLCCKETGWDAFLVVAGTGPELGYWKRRVAESGRENDIRLLGFTKVVSSVLASADALISPTRFEPYGQGVHEAICCGLPAFVTRCAGIAERFPADLHDLLLDDPPDALQISQSLRGWHKNLDGYRRRMFPFTKQLRRRTWSDMAGEFIAAVGEDNR